MKEDFTVGNFNKGSGEEKKTNPYELKKIYVPETNPSEANNINVESMETTDDVLNVFDRVFDTKTFKNKNANEVTKIVDELVKRQMKMAYNPSIIGDQIKKWQEAKEDDEKKIKKLVKEIDSTRDLLEKGRKESELAVLKSRLEGIKKMQEELQKRVPASSLSDEDEVNFDRGFSLN